LTSAGIASHRSGPGAEVGSIEEIRSPVIVMTCAPTDARAVPIACEQMMVREVSLLMTL